MANQQLRLSTPPLLTLFSDYQDQDGYTAVVTGRILNQCRQTQIHPLSQHAGFPFRLEQAAFRWRRLWPWFPHGTLHCSCLDPSGHGAITIVAVAGHILCGFDRQFLQAAIPYPKHGLWYELPTPQTSPTSTFRARDILAPIVGQMLSSGQLPAQAQPCDFEPAWPGQQPIDQQCEEQWGTVIDNDTYGNIITDLISNHHLLDDQWTVLLGNQTIPICTAPFAQTRGVHARIGCDGHLIIAVNGGSAANHLSCPLGTAVGLAKISRNAYHVD